MQQPTCKNIRIRSTEDAHKIFYAIHRGLLQMVTRRLDPDERNALRSGCIYVWEERAGGSADSPASQGMERFTEGRRWSPSRVREDFLFYYEKYTPQSDAPEARPPRDWEPLVKQTISVWATFSPGEPARKWHLTAYFTQASVDDLMTVDDIFPNLSPVPEGLFKSARTSKKIKSDAPKTKTGATAPRGPISRTYSAYSKISAQSSPTDTSAQTQTVQWGSSISPEASGTTPTAFGDRAATSPEQQSLHGQPCLGIASQPHLRSASLSPTQQRYEHQQTHMGFHHVSVPSEGSSMNTSFSETEIQHAPPAPTYHEFVSAHQQHQHDSLPVVNLVQASSGDPHGCHDSTLVHTSHNSSDASGVETDPIHGRAHSARGEAAVMHPSGHAGHRHRHQQRQNTPQRGWLTVDAGAASCHGVSDIAHNDQTDAYGSSAQRALAPLHELQLQRNAAYRRDQVDDEALRQIPLRFGSGDVPDQLEPPSHGPGSGPIVVEMVPAGTPYRSYHMRGYRG